MEKYSRVMGILKDIVQQFVGCQLVETYITIRTANGKNDFFHFLGLVPESLLGKQVDFEERVIEEDQQYYYVQQTIMNMEPVRYDPFSSFQESAKEGFECHHLIKAEGKIAK